MSVLRKIMPETRCAHHIIYLRFYNNNWVDNSAGELSVTTWVLTWFITSTYIYSILKCVTLYQVTIIPSYLYSQMRELKIFKDF